MNCFSGTKTEWIHESVIYNFTNSITSAVYSMGLFDHEPDSDQWPFFTKEVFYIGMSGGKDEKYFMDKKNKHIDKGRLQTHVHARIKSHHSGKTGKINNAWVQAQIDAGKQLYYCFIRPPENLNDSVTRNWLSNVESEQIYTYHQIYGNLPKLNFAESTSSNINPNSHSQRYLKKMRDESLDRFFL